MRSMHLPTQKPLKIDANGSLKALPDARIHTNLLNTE